MNRLDYYFRQKVSESELDLGFTYCEQADLAIMLDQGRTGIMTGLGVSQQSVPNMTAQVAAGVAYDPTGKRCNVPATQNPDCSQDYNGVSTAVAGGGNEKWISIQLFASRALSDPRVDGASATVYFQRGETFLIKVVQGTEAAAGAAVRPALDPNASLLADIKLSFGTTSVTTGIIDTTRRQDSIVLTGSPRSIRRGLVKDAIGDLLTLYNNFVTGVTDHLPAASVDYAGGPTWADGATNPAATVEAQIDKILTDLGGAGDGAAKIHTTLSGGLSAGTLRAQLNQLDVRTFGYLRVVDVQTRLQVLQDTTSGAIVDVTGARVDFTTARVGDLIVFMAQVYLNRGSTAANEHFIYAHLIDGALASAFITGTGRDTTQFPAAETDVFYPTTVCGMVGPLTDATGGAASIKIRHQSFDGVHTVHCRVYGLTAVLLRP